MSISGATRSRVIIAVTSALLIAGLLVATGSVRDRSVSAWVFSIGSLMTPFIAVLFARWSVGPLAVSLLTTALGVWAGVLLALTVVNRLVPAAVSISNAAFPAPVIVGLGVAL